MIPKVSARTKKLPNVSVMFPRDFWTEVAKVVEGDILDRIDKQQTPGGSRIKRNAPSTIAQKRKHGRPALSLVDKRKRFVHGNFRSYAPKYKPGGRGVVVRPATADARRIAMLLLRKGYKWIGLSAQGRRALRSLLRRHIRETVQRMAGKRGAA